MRMVLLFSCLAVFTSYLPVLAHAESDRRLDLCRTALDSEAQSDLMARLRQGVSLVTGDRNSAAARRTRNLMLFDESGAEAPSGKKSGGFQFQPWAAGKKGVGVRVELTW